VPVEEYPLSQTIKTQIEMSQPMAEWEAAYAARLDLYRWERNEYDADFKARVLAWHSRHIELELHRQDAVSRAAKRGRR
jgi:hypothetical protein